jgi:hypothetical protein
LAKCDVDVVVIDQIWRVHQKVVHTLRYAYAQVADLVSLAVVQGHILLWGFTGCRLRWVFDPNC